MEVVKWKIKVGGPEKAYLCTSVNAIKASHFVNEEEYLFQAYSAFTVVKCKWSSLTPATMDQPHEIFLQAVRDCTKCTGGEGQPLAKWY